MICHSKHAAGTDTWESYSRVEENNRPVLTMIVETQAYYCQGLDLNSLSKGPTDAASGMQQLTTPLSAFNCDLSRVDQIGFQVRPAAIQS